MKYLFTYIALFILICTNAQSPYSQYRMVGNAIRTSGNTTAWQTINDSTYLAEKVIFFGDQTGGRYYPTQITDSFRVFTGNEQLYRIDSVDQKTLGSVRMWIVEYEGNHGLPRGQLMVYDPDGRTKLPSVPFGINGINAQMQAAINAYNARIEAYQVIDQFNIVTDSLYISLSGDNVDPLVVDLLPYLDNTDAQTLSWAQSTGSLIISGGNSVIINPMTGATGAVNGQQGLVPRPVAGQNTMFLRGDGSWANPSVGGDNWGSQVVISDATLTGDGTPSSPLSVSGSYLDNQTIDSFLISNNLLILTLEDDNEAPYTVDLSVYLDNTDTQDLSLSNDTLYLVDGGNVYLGTYLDNTRDSTVLLQDSIIVSYYNGIESRRDTIRFTALNTDEQTLAYNGAGDLSISNGNSVDLSDLLDNTDNQTIDSLLLSGSTLILAIENDNESPYTLDLSVFLDNTDDQQVSTFSILANILTLEIENDGQPAHTVDLSPYLDNTDAQILSYNTITNRISISNGNDIDISELDTDKQTVDTFLISGTNLMLALERDGEAPYIVDLSPFLDSATVDNPYGGTNNLQSIIDSLFQNIEYIVIQGDSIVNAGSIIITNNYGGADSLSAVLDSLFQNIENITGDEVTIVNNYGGINNVQSYLDSIYQNFQTLLGDNIVNAEYITITNNYGGVDSLGAVLDSLFQNIENITGDEISFAEYITIINNYGGVDSLGAVLDSLYQNIENLTSEEIFITNNYGGPNNLQVYLDSIYNEIQNITVEGDNIINLGDSYFVNNYGGDSTLQATIDSIYQNILTVDNVDSTTLVQDSILVSYYNGAESRRDTIRVASISGDNITNGGNIIVNNNYNGSDSLQAVLDSLFFNIENIIISGDSITNAEYITIINNFGGTDSLGAVLDSLYQNIQYIYNTNITNPQYITITNSYGGVDSLGAVLDSLFQNIENITATEVFITNNYGGTNNVYAYIDSIYQNIQNLAGDNITIINQFGGGDDVQSAIDSLYANINNITGDEITNIDLSTIINNYGGINDLRSFLDSLYNNIENIVATEINVTNNYGGTNNVNAYLDSLYQNLLTVDNVDSTVLVQDSIMVSYYNGIEARRDTVRVTSVTEVAGEIINNAEYITITNNYGGTDSLGAVLDSLYQNITNIIVDNISIINKYGGVNNLQVYLDSLYQNIENITGDEITINNNYGGGTDLQSALDSLYQNLLVVDNVDSTVVVEDSIIVSYYNGVENRRDTIRVAGLAGIDISNAEYITIVNNYGGTDSLGAVLDSIYQNIENLIATEIIITNNYGGVNNLQVYLDSIYNNIQNIEVQGDNIINLGDSYFTNVYGGDSTLQSYLDSIYYNIQNIEGTTINNAEYITITNNYGGTDSLGSYLDSLFQNIENIVATEVTVTNNYGGTNNVNAYLDSLYQNLLTVDNVDSTVVVEDSILVSYYNGIENRRDTLRINGGVASQVNGSNITNTENIFITNNYGGVDSLQAALDSLYQNIVNIIINGDSIVNGGNITITNNYGGVNNLQSILDSLFTNIENIVAQEISITNNYGGTNNLQIYLDSIYNNLQNIEGTVINNAEYITIANNYGGVDSLGAVLDSLYQNIVNVIVNGTQITNVNQSTITNNYGGVNDLGSYLDSLFNNIENIAGDEVFVTNNYGGSNDVTSYLDSLYQNLLTVDNVDSTILVQDSILISFYNQVEVRRDTIRVAGISGENITNGGDIVITNNYGGIDNIQSFFDSLFTNIENITGDEITVVNNYGGGTDLQSSLDSLFQNIPDPQILSYNPTTDEITISDGNTIDITEVNTDDQQVTNFSVSGYTLTLEVEDDGQAPHQVTLPNEIWYDSAYYYQLYIDTLSPDYRFGLGLDFNTLGNYISALTLPSRAINIVGNLSIPISTNFEAAIETYGIDVYTEDHVGQIGGRNIFGGLYFQGNNTAASTDAHAFHFRGFLENEPTAEGATWMEFWKHDGAGNLIAFSDANAMLLNIYNGFTPVFRVFADGDLSITKNFLGGGYNLSVTNPFGGGNFLQQTIDSIFANLGESNDLTTSVVWDTIPDLYVQSSSVTQHEGDLSILQAQVIDLPSVENHVITPDATGALTQRIGGASDNYSVIVNQEETPNNWWEFGFSQVDEATLSIGSNPISSNLNSEEYGVKLYGTGRIEFGGRDTIRDAYGKTYFWPTRIYQQNYVNHNRVQIDSVSRNSAYVPGITRWVHTRNDASNVPMPDSSVLVANWTVERKSGGNVNSYYDYIWKEAEQDVRYRWGYDRTLGTTEHQKLIQNEPSFEIGLHENFIRAYGLRNTVDSSAAVTPTNFLYTDATGKLLPGNITFLSDLVSDSLTTIVEVNDLSSAVIWANVPDANITESSVTQHEAALSIIESQISDLQHTILGTVSENRVALGSATDTLTSSPNLYYSGDTLYNVIVGPYTGGFYAFSECCGGGVEALYGAAEIRNPTGSPGFRINLNSDGRTFNWGGDNNYGREFAITGSYGRNLDDYIFASFSSSDTIALQLAKEHPDSIRFTRLMVVNRNTNTTDISFEGNNGVSNWDYQFPLSSPSSSKVLGDSDGDGRLEWVDWASQLSDLTDVNISTVTNRNVLIANGVDWESRPLVEADISDLQPYVTSNIYTSNGTTGAGRELTVTDSLKIKKTNSGNYTPSLVLEHSTGFFGAAGGIAMHYDLAQEAVFDYLIEPFSVSAGGKRVFDIAYAGGVGIAWRAKDTLSIIISSANGPVILEGETYVQIGVNSGSGLTDSVLIEPLAIPYDVAIDSVLGVTPLGKIGKYAISDLGGGATQLSDLTDTDLTGLADNNLLQYNSGTGNWEPTEFSTGTTSAPILAVQKTSNQVLTGTPTVIAAYDTPLKTTTMITFDNTNGFAIINSAGLYEIVFQAVTEMTTGNTRRTSYLELQVSTGSGWVDVTELNSSVYNRIAGAGEGTGVIVYTNDFAAGDSIRIVGSDNSSSETIQLTRAYLQIKPLEIPYALIGGGGTEINDLTASVTWANVPDANITQSSVIQHEGAIDAVASLATTFTAGNFVFNVNQTVGAGQDNYVLTYDNSTGEIGLEAAAGGGGGGSMFATYSPVGISNGITAGVPDTLKIFGGNFTYDYAIDASIAGDTLLLKFNPGSLTEYPAGTMDPINDRVLMFDNSATGFKGKSLDVINLQGGPVNITTPANASTTNVSLESAKVGFYEQIIMSSITTGFTLTFSNPINGGTYVLHFRTVTGTDAVTFPANVYWMDETAVGTINITQATKYTMYYDGTNYYME